MKKWSIGIFALVLAISLLGCGANQEATGDSYYSNGAGMDMSMEAEGEFYQLSDSVLGKGESPAAQSSMPEGRKWIVTMRMEAETEDLDGMLADVQQQVAQLGGYLEDSSIYNGSAYGGQRYRHGDLTIRIPADKADSFAAGVGRIANVVSSNKDQQDITLTYVSTESRMKALKVEEDRLLELLARAENMSDLLQIESRLTEVRYELERVTSQLRVYDNQVDYATIYLNIQEVQEYTPVEEATLWQRIGGGFVGSLKALGNLALELLVGLVVNLPYLVVFGGLAVLAVIIIRKKSRNRKAKKEGQE